MDIDPYVAPKSLLDLTPPFEAKLTSSIAISETELIAFAGGRYPQKMAKFISGSSRHAGFNIWAALFGIQWYFYRKLYLFGLFSAALDFLIPFLFFVSSRSAFGVVNKDFTYVAGAIVFVLTRILVGYMANIALCLKAEKVIQEVDDLNKDNETHLRLIAHAGGVSFPSFLAIYAVLGVLQALDSL
jgi:hypothetical protein